MSIRIIFSFVIATVFFGFTSVYAEEALCSPRTTGPDEPEELLMYENDFSLAKSLNSVKFLRTDFSKRIWGPEPVKDFRSWSGHYISYMNSLRFIEGALLREDALRLRLNSQLLSMRKPNSVEAKSAADEFQKTKDKFCKFIKNSIYID